MSDDLLSLGADDIRPVKLDGRSAFVRALSLEEISSVHTLIDKKIYDNIAIWLAASICDDKGDLIYSESDIPRIAKMPGHRGKKLFDEIQIVNGWEDPEPPDDAKKKH